MNMNLWVSDGEIFAQGTDASTITGVKDLRSSVVALAFRPGQQIQFGAMGEEGEIAITLRAVFWRLGFQVTEAASLVQVVLYLPTDTTAVFGPGVDSQTNAEK